MSALHPTAACNAAVQRARSLEGYTTLVCAALLLSCRAGGSNRCADSERFDGSRCVARCGAGQRLEDGRCVDLCPTGHEWLGTECHPACTASQQRVGQNCLPRCDAGQERLDGRCVAACGEGEQRVDGQCEAPPLVRVNSVGYLPAQFKQAVLTGPGNGSFEVVRLRGEGTVDAGAALTSDAGTAGNYADGEVVLRGGVEGPYHNEDTAEQLWRATFSELDTPGHYVMVVPELGKSARFEIGARVYDEALRVSMLGYHGLRCGSAVHFEHQGDGFEHAACHTADGFATIDPNAANADEVIPSRGGWHDAGDYGKYVANGAFSVGTLLLAWEHFRSGLERLELVEIPEHAGAIPDYLDEVKVELDWLLTMQRADGAVHDKLTEAEFGGFVLPERDNKRRALAPISGEATASFAAVMAQAARVYQPFDPDFAASCLHAAERAHGFLSENPAPIPFSAEGFGTGRYNSPDPDERLWASVELWRSTGEAQYLKDFEEESAAFELEERWDWPDVQALAFASYLSSDDSARDAVTLGRLREAFTTSARTLALNSERHGYGRAIGAHYIWGSNGIAIRAVVNLATAHHIDPDAEFERAALRQLDHLFGVNTYGRSQVTGVGFLPPLHPHHRPSGADTVAAPWPGLLVGGANPAPADGAVASSELPARSWTDVQESYWSNEVAINWNAPLVYALAWACSER